MVSSKISFAHRNETHKILENLKMKAWYEVYEVYEKPKVSCQDQRR